MKEIKGMESPEDLIAFVEGDERKSVLDAAPKAFDNLAEPGDEAPTPTPKPKEPKDEQIVEAYENLEDLLTAKDKIERTKKRPHKHYFVHYRQVTRLHKLFLRNLR